MAEKVGLLRKALRKKSFRNQTAFHAAMPPEEPPVMKCMSGEGESVSPLRRQASGTSSSTRKFVNSGPYWSNSSARMPRGAPSGREGGSLPGLQKRSIPHGMSPSCMKIVRMWTIVSKSCSRRR